MARRKADKIDVGQNSEKPERKKREREPLKIYRVQGDSDVSLNLIPIEGLQTNDFKSAVGLVKSSEPGNYAIGRLTFLSLEEQTTKKTVLVRK